MPWTEVSQQSETWTQQVEPVRVFDPLVFARDPVFDTGSTGGLWVEATEAPEVWTPA